MDKLTKLGILAEAARFDAACTSSGVTRGPREGMVGDACASGLCHSFSADGRCITLLKVLMSNACSYDCAYCVNRRGASCPRATFEPRELAELTVDFYKRNYIEGLFLSSAVLGNPDNTTERMIACLEALRGEFRFNGYVHAKVIPGSSPELVDRLGRLADRLSVNLELPSRASLASLCPDKDARSVMDPMAQIATTRHAEEQALLDSPAGKKALARRRREKGSHVSEGMQVTSVGARYTLGRPTSAVPNALRKFVPCRSVHADHRRRHPRGRQSHPAALEVAVRPLRAQAHLLLGIHANGRGQSPARPRDARALAPRAPPLPGRLAHALLRLHARRAGNAQPSLARPRRGPKACLGARAHGRIPRRGHGCLARDAASRSWHRSDWGKAHPRSQADQAPPCG